MNSDEIIERLEANTSNYRSSVEDSATLTMVALATVARELYPAAVYVEFSVTDQDHSGSLDVVAVCDGDEQALSGDDEEIDADYIAPNLDNRNKSVWLPYMTPSDQHDRYRSYYHLIIDKVLTEITLPEPEPATPDPVAAFLAEYAAWGARRTAISEAEENGERVKAGDWEGSDDTAVDLLRNAARLLGAKE